MRYVKLIRAFAGGTRWYLWQYGLANWSGRLRSFADDGGRNAAQPYKLNERQRDSIANDLVFGKRVDYSHPRFKVVIHIKPKARDPYVFVPFGFCQRQLFEFSRGIHRDHFAPFFLWMSISASERRGPDASKQQAEQCY